MSAGPWVVRFDDVDPGVVEVYNTKTHDFMSVWAASCDTDETYQLGKRIAERLNRTEGDER